MIAMKIKVKQRTIQCRRSQTYQHATEMPEAAAKEMASPAPPRTTLSHYPPAPWTKSEAANDVIWRETILWKEAN